jgi:acyl dehydratase
MPTVVRRPPRLGGLYVKAAVAAVGRRGHELPGTEQLSEDVTVGRDQLAEYARVCGFPVADALPVTYPHVLAFPLQVTLMAQRSFPLPLPGLVHVRNRITQHRGIDAAERLAVRVHPEALRAHAKGALVDLIAQVTAAGEAVWEGRSTYLARGATAPEAGAEPTGPPGIEDGPPVATWRVDAGTGRRYARVSGDVNPIHLHPWTAKAFGFPRAIAHGMWTAAHALAALQGRLPEALTYDVAFGKPLLLPSTAELRTRPADGGWDVELRGRQGPHLTARVAPLAADQSG